jgi:hypothetical protein
MWSRRASHPSSTRGRSPRSSGSTTIGSSAHAFTLGGGLSLVRSKRVIAYPGEPDQNAAAIGVGPA